jgi:hypothetical protein
MDGTGTRWQVWSCTSLVLRKAAEPYTGVRLTGGTSCCRPGVPGAAFIYRVVSR